MKILLFSRCELVHLYGRIGPWLKSMYKHEIIYVAYSVEEEIILKKKYGVNDVINLKKSITNYIKTENLDIGLLNYIDQLFIKNSKGRFNLNSAIQSDRSFEYLNYDECLLLAQVYYRFWNSILVKNKINFFLHEPTAHFMTHIASILCKENGCLYITQIQCYGENKFNWLVVSGDDGFPDEIKINLHKSECLTESDRKRIDDFIKTFRNDFDIFFSLYVRNRNSFFYDLHFTFKTIRIHYQRSFKNLFKKSPDKLLDHMEHYYKKSENWLCKIKHKWEQTWLLNFDDFNPSLKYYYFPIHLEPEAVVLYWGDGLYKNQVKLIENVAAQLPPDTYLYVKDHPHAQPYRSLKDYKKILAIPNVKLLDSKISGKLVIRDCIGVITITGTAGFEALLLNKAVFTFGNVYYNLCKGVYNVKNIRDLREKLYLYPDDHVIDDEEMKRFIHAYLVSNHEGFTDYFLDYVKLCKIDENSNAKNISQNLNSYFNTIVNNS